MPKDPSQPKNKAIFTSGPIMSHIVNMTMSSAIGLIAIFFVDLLDLYFLSLLGSLEIMAGMGYAGAIAFFAVSLSIGLSIGAGALTARALGENRLGRARRLATHSIIFAFVLSSFVAVILYVLLPDILTMLGASGLPHKYACDYLGIFLFSLPFLAIGMSGTAMLRSVGDGRYAMQVTLAGAGVNALLDPLFIFTFNMGVEGAALATVLARLTILVLAIYGLVNKHCLIGKWKKHKFREDMPRILDIVIPSSLTNIATPIGNAIVTYFITRYGMGAVAAWGIISRIVPVAFSGLFALSGAVGPMVGQNLGAKKFGRLRQIIHDALKFNLVYSLVVWGLLLIFSEIIADMFNATGESKKLVQFFCIFVAPGFIFTGMIFSANAAYNNMGKPYYSTLVNWGRATLGNIPFIYIGGLLAGAEGMIAGNMLGALLFGIGSIYYCYWLIDELEKSTHRQMSIKDE